MQQGIPGHQINYFFCREMPLNKYLSPSVVTISLLNRALIYRWLMFPVFAAPLVDVQDCFALCVEHQARTEQPPWASLACSLGRDVSPKCGPCFNSVAESPALLAPCTRAGPDCSTEWPFHQGWPAELWREIRKPISDSFSSAAAAKLLWYPHP